MRENQPYFIAGRWQSGWETREDSLKSTNGRVTTIKNKQLRGAKMVIPSELTDGLMTPVLISTENDNHFVVGELSTFDEITEKIFIQYYEKLNCEFKDVQFDNLVVKVPVFRGERNYFELPLESWESNYQVLMNQFVYGTLRVGESNYRWAAKGVNEKSNILNIPMPFHKMYSVSPMGGYPITVKTSSVDDIVEGDIVEFNNEATSLSVAKMEVGAGYYMGTVNYDGFDHGIWLQRKMQVVGKTEIPSGIWNKKKN